MKITPRIRTFALSLVVLAGAALFLCLFSANALASTTSADSTSPWIINIDSRDQSEPETVDIEADYDDMGSGVEVEEAVIEVPDAVVTGCAKTTNHVRCKATKLTHGDHDAIVKVKDRSGNTGSSSKRFRYDKISPVIENISASSAAVSVKYNDPAPSSGIASVVVYVDGQVLNCRASGSGGCDDDHDGYDHDHDGDDRDDDSYDDDHDGYDDDHDGRDDDHGGYYEDSSGGSHSSDGYYRDSDDDRGGADSGRYTCPILGNLGCGTHQVTVTVTDRAGNTTTGTAAIDNGPCDLTPPTTTDDAAAGWQYSDVAVMLTCTDNPGGSGCAITTYEVDAGATQYGNSVDITAEGIHTITYRSTDNAGNVETSKTATVMIDKTPPLVTTTGDVTVEAAGPSGAPASFTADATDALSGAGPVSCSSGSGSTFPLGSTVVTCTATDNAGNSGSASLTVNVVDTTAPVLSLPADMIVQSAGLTAPALFSATATDLVDGDVAVTCTPPSGSEFPIGTTFVSCTATDAAGNAATGGFSVTVCQSGRPLLSIVCPPIVNVNDPNQDIFWKDKANRILTIKYTFRNGAGPDAYNVKVLSSSGRNGIVCLTPMPLLVGDIPAGGSVKVALDYQIPVGVPLSTTVTACAEDQCGNIYQ